MTSHEDPTETLLAQSLDRQAAQAPRDDHLLDHVHARLRRRRSGRAAGSLFLACAAVATGIFGVHSVLDTAPESVPATQISPGPPSPESGWRWESYRTIQLQVPSNWGYGTTNQPPCLVKAKVTGYVGRTGPIPYIGCKERLPELEVRSPYVWFASLQPVGIQTSGDGWTEETRELDGVKVTVLTADDTLRQRIFASVAPIVSVDGNGCPSVVPLDQHEGPALASVGTVRSISVCSYRGDVLSGSSKLDADQAQAITAAILAAPAGDGPNPPKCFDSSPVDLLLKVDGSSAHDAEVAIRFSRCTDNGAWDGVTKRRLTKPYLEPLLTGPHKLLTWTDESGIGLLRNPPKTK